MSEIETLRQENTRLRGAIRETLAILRSGAAGQIAWINGRTIDPRIDSLDFAVARLSRAVEER
jgi:hypothetical protein